MVISSFSLSCVTMKFTIKENKKKKNKVTCNENGYSNEHKSWDKVFNSTTFLDFSPLNQIHENKLWNWTTNTHTTSVHEFI